MFISWKNWIRREKIETARVHLLSELYFSHPPLFDGMRRVQRELEKLATLQLVCDFDGRVMAIDELTARSVRISCRCALSIVEPELTLATNRVQTACLEARAAQIRAISSAIQDILLRVCRGSLESMESAYGGFPGQEFALSTRRSSNFQLFDGYVERELALATADAQFLQHKHLQMGATPSRLSPTTSAQLRAARKKHVARMKLRQQQLHHHLSRDPLGEIRWTMAAIRRRKCVHLTKFVFLVDFMLLDVYFDVVVRSVDALHSHLLRGANATYIQQLLSHDDLVSAFHKTLNVPRHTREEVQGESGLQGGGGVSDASGSRQRLRLSKQEAKRFLRLMMGDKFQTQAEHAGVEDAKSAAVWMESKFEEVFLLALAKRMDAMHVDSVTLYDLLELIESDVSKELILSPFAGAGHCIFQAVSDTEAVERQITEANAAQDSGFREIAALAPVPLLRVALELVRDQQAAYGIRVQPDMSDIAAVIKRMLTSVVEVFEGVSPLSAHPDLASVLRFSDDIRSSLLALSSDGNAARPSTNAAHHLSSSNNNVGDDDDDAGPRSNAERLVERLNDADAFNLLLNLIDERIAAASDAAAQLVGCYADTMRLHAHHERYDFDAIAARFRRNEYSLLAMTNAVVELNNQVKQSVSQQLTSLPAHALWSCGDVMCAGARHPLLEGFARRGVPPLRRPAAAGVAVAVAAALHRAAQEAVPLAGAREVQ